MTAYFLEQRMLIFQVSTQVGDLCINSLPFVCIVIDILSSLIVTGTLMMITIPALYSKYGNYVDKCCGIINHQFSKHYRIVDESVFNRLPHNMSKDKES